MKELVNMKKKIPYSHTIFYTPEIQKMEFHIPHVQILGANHFGNFSQTAFKRRK